MQKEDNTAFKNMASFCIWNNDGLISEGEQRGVMP